MKQGRFITFEGTDGSGKTTQIKFLSDYLKQKGYDVLLVREPGSTNIGEKIRSIILDVKNKEMEHLTEVLLYASARAQLVMEVIKPAIEKGKTVICDRFIDSSYAYQGFGRGMDIKMIEKVNSFVLENVMPDITLFFDISPETALQRRTVCSTADRIEKEEIEFHSRVYSGYKKLVSLYPERIKCIDANTTVEKVSQDVRNYIDKLLGLSKK